MPSKREVQAGVAFFALSAVVVVAFRRPFDVTGWACLVACVAFVAFGCAAILKPDLAVGRRIAGLAATRGAPADLKGVLDENDKPRGSPSAEEMRILGETIAALEAVDALEPGEVDALTLWTAAQRLDPGQAIGIHEALGSLSALHGFGRAHIGRLTFVPSHTEYDAPLLAEITASLLRSLGRPVQAGDVAVALPPDEGQGTAQISFPVGGRTETVICVYHWKYPPADLCPALVRFRNADDPRDLVAADPGDQTLIFAAIRSGTLAELNRRLSAQDDLFYEA